MAGPNDESEAAHTLPRPELNPLLNPHLAENMGRWAEVYFTAAPEKREEAVLELIRELEAENPGRGVPDNSQPPVDYRAPEYPSHPPGAPVSTIEDQVPTRCHSCGHDNPRSHQFCGMCGLKLDEPPADRRVATFPGENGLASGHVDRPEAGSSGVRSSLNPDSTEPNRAFGQPTAGRDDLALFRSISEGQFSNDNLESELERPSGRPYRAYIVAAMAIVILVLVYVAWRGSQAMPQRSQQVSPPPEAARTGSAAAAPLNPPQVNEAERTAPTTSVGTAPKAGNVGSGKADTTAQGSSTAAAAPVSAAAAGNDPLTLQGTGTEELAIAQRYLAGGNGLERNSGEAAQWLWKSIAKHNSEAMLLLADLYLKGDGVSKNCDQARVLLDSAARKGMRGAGERLRNFQAFGCQ